MAIPHGALVLVADGKKVLWLRNQGDSELIDLRTESHDRRDDPMDREIKTDAPGTQGQRWGDGRPAMDEVDFHQQVNTALQTTLIPSASNPELKDLLSTGLRIFEGHQQHAEHLVQALR